ncbi:hypothetical protein F4802DRAFT_592264 [Xylaria palmicola]|nr:hypothetical protein F4802DRAFT_592264 [Xylaria palmicola]
MKRKKFSLTYVPACFPPPTLLFLLCFLVFLALTDPNEPAPVFSIRCYIVRILYLDYNVILYNMYYY